MMMHEYRSALDELAAFNAGEGEDEDGKAIFGRLVAAERKIIAARARDWHGVLDKVTVAQNVARDERYMRRRGYPVLLALLASIRYDLANGAGSKSDEGR